jgi:hypothetical protein
MRTPSRTWSVLAQDQYRTPSFSLQVVQNRIAGWGGFLPRLVVLRFNHPRLNAYTYRKPLERRLITTIKQILYDRRFDHTSFVHSHCWRKTRPPIDQEVKPLEASNQEVVSASDHRSRTNQADNDVQILASDRLASSTSSPDCSVQSTDLRNII